MPDDERLTWAIQEAAGVEQIDVPHHVMVKLAETLRQHSFQVCIKGLLTEKPFLRPGHHRAPGHRALRRCH